MDRGGQRSLAYCSLGLQRARDDLATAQQSLPPSFSVPLTLTFSGTRSIPSLNVSPEDGLHHGGQNSLLL